MSFGFGIGDLIAVSKFANKVRRDFVGSPKEFKDISDEVRSLSILLTDLEIVLSERELTKEQQTGLKEISGTCGNVLCELEDRVQKYHELQGSKTSDLDLGGRVKRVWKRLKWEPEDIRQLRERLVANITLLSAYLEGVYGREIRVANRGIERLNRNEDEQERTNILDWLTSVEYATQQHDFIHRRQSGTGQWLLDSSEYQTWVNSMSQGQSLYCPGIPGAGKTILSAVVVEDLTTRYGSSPDIGIAYVYFNFRRRYEQNAEDILASILKQLCQGFGSLPKDLNELWQDHKAKQTRPSLPEITKCIRSIVSILSTTFIVVDALDECQHSHGVRTRFLEEIFRLQDVTSPPLNIFATSRLIPEIMEKFQARKSAKLEIYATRDDVERYLEGNMENLLSFVQRSKSLQDEIKTAISGAVDGMFLLAQIYIGSLNDKPSPKAIRNTLAQLQKQNIGSSEESKVQILSQAYGQAMERINGQAPGFRDLAKRVIAWITCAKRPLTILELRHALAIEVGETHLDEENLTQTEDLITVCAGIVTIDQESDIIRLVHYTAQEYFERTQNLWFPNAEADIALACVTYMSFDAFEDGFCRGDAEFERRLEMFPLYDYTTHYWGEHTRQSSIESSCPEILDFLMSRLKVDAATQAMMAVKFKFRLSPELEKQYSEEVPQDVSGLHLASMLGLPDFVRALLNLGNDPRSRDGCARTPLHWAAENGHRAVVELLLATDVLDLNDRDADGDTPLLAAAWAGRNNVVSQLLATGKVNVNRTDTSRRTPLHYAAENGHETTVALLLSAGRASPNLKDDVGQTPLFLALEGGYNRVVEALLATGSVETNCKDEFGDTPLTLAASYGKCEVVDVLLSIGGADPNLPDSGYGRAPLGYAASRGNLEVVELLLAQESIDPNWCDFFGHSALGWAEDHEHYETAQLIRSHPRCNGKLSSDPIVSRRKVLEWWGELTLREKSQGKDPVIVLTPY